MRQALLLVLLAGCPVDGGDCSIDTDCSGGQLCGRDHVCASSSDLRMVKTQWTINGAPASGAACNNRDLFIEFRGATEQDRLGFSPVPCPNGQFVVDKLPLRFTSVELGVDGGGDVGFAGFDADGVASIDLQF